MSHSLGRSLLRALLLIAFVMLVGLIVLEPWSTSLFSLLLWQIAFVRILITRFTVQERLLRLHAVEPGHAVSSSGITQIKSRLTGVNG